VRISFSLKLGVLITVLTTTVSGLGLAIFYNQSKNVVVDNIGSRLLDIGLVTSQMLTTEDRRAIADIRQEILDSSTTMDSAVENVRNEGCGEVLLENCPTMSDETRKKLENDIRYLRLRQKLREVVMSTQLTIGEEVPVVHMIENTLEEASHLAYLQVPIPQSPNHDITLVLADNDDVNDPLGNLYQSSDEELFAEPFRTAKPSVSKDWYFDEFCSDKPCMTAVVPVLDETSKVIAIIGLDYQLDEEWGALGQLRTYCYTVISIVLVISVVLSIMLASMVNTPLRLVVQGAQRLQDKDFSDKIKTTSRDEFGYLATILNTMGEEINSYANGLQALVDERTSELASATNSIQALNDKLQKENESLGAELDIAMELHKKVLPSPGSLEEFTGLDVGYFSRLCVEVGGDYVDAIHMGGQHVLAIGDVSERGLETDLFMFNMRTGLRSLLEAGVSPEDCISHLNRIACEYGKVMHYDKHMTLSLLAVNDNGTMTLTGQHEDAVIVRAAGNVEIIDTVSLGLPLGLMEDITDYTSSMVVRLEPNDTLILVTNGIFEAQNSESEYFGAEHLKDIVTQNINSSAQDVADKILAALDAFSPERISEDDLSCIVVREPS